jgi:hypothetical protein
VLPADLVDRLDLDRLARVSGSFVDTTLRWRHSDLLFTAPLDGHDAFVYVLVEHQSNTDALMPFRMLRYMVRIWDRYVAVLTYIETVGEAPTEELHDLFTQLGPEAEEAYVTTADMLRAEGRAETLIQLLTLKFGTLSHATLDLLHTASTEQLETWTARILTADTLEQVLR